MAVTADIATTPDRNFEKEKNAEFSPARLRAPFFLRCGALIIDYILLVATPILWLLLTKYFGDGGPNATMNSTGWTIAIVIGLANLLILPAMWGKSVGKMFTGQTIVKKDGTRAGIGRILVRNTFGYLLTAVT